MKTKIWKKMSILLTAVCVLTAIPACGGRGPETDNTKTQLYVSTIPAGYGDGWLVAAARRFEEAYAEVSLEEGKVGVQVWTDMAAPSGHSAATDLPNTTKDVIFSENTDYYDLVNQNLLHDITTAVESPLSEFEETDSIADKMTADDRAFYKTSADANGKYYAVPFCTNYTNIIYDVDLWGDPDEGGFYFEADTTKPDRPALKIGGGYRFTADLSKRSNGPDGKTGVIGGVDYSVDDGLPATYEQFFAMCYEMADRGIEPIIWPGTYQFHMYRFLYTLWMSNEGYDQMKLNYTLDGQATDLVEGFNPDGSLKYLSTPENPQPISSENGYLLSKQAGKYYALSWLETLLDNSSYYDSVKCFGSMLHTSAQNAFLRSKYDTSMKRIAMFIDGGHWEYEATQTFNTLVSRYGESASKMNRKLAFLPLPKPTDKQIGQQSIVPDLASATIYIPAKVDPNKAHAAETFLRFMHTQASLVEFNQLTSITRPYDYEISEAEQEDMTYFGRSMYKNFRTSKVLASRSRNNTFVKNYNIFNPLMTSIWATNVNIGGQLSTYDVPSTAMYNNHVSAQDYFLGMSNRFSPEYWNTIK